MRHIEDRARPAGNGWALAFFWPGAGLSGPRDARSAVAIMSATHSCPRMFQELIAKMAREVESCCTRAQRRAATGNPEGCRTRRPEGKQRIQGGLGAPAVGAGQGQLTQRVTKLANIDVAQIAADKVGLGSRVVVEDKQSERETYELVFGDAGELQDGHVTMGSPIGRALQGKGVGEQAVLSCRRGFAGS